MYKTGCRVPQHFGQFDFYTVAQVLQIKYKIDALLAIENGSTDPRHFDAITDDWTIRERLQAALEQWRLPDLSPDIPFSLLSGSEKTRVLLAGIDLHQPELVLMDEPTNHLDTSGREKLYRTPLKALHPPDRKGPHSGSQSWSYSSLVLWL